MISSFMRPLMQTETAWLSQEGEEKKKFPINNIF